ncbi:hypothetical protein [Thiohalobacter sp.]|uniref:hypothetical protein n=1 Tax=Thiohalobacter sp. TaxID=2025948 RepID=UPI002617635B|nr:hypothetical protein [Thiohalobacter sp.]
MNVLLFFLATLMAGAVAGLVSVLLGAGFSSWPLAGVAGLVAFWALEGWFHEAFGYHPAEAWLERLLKH